MSTTGHVTLSLHTQVNATRLKPDSGSTTLLCFEEGYSYSVQLLRLNNKWGGSTAKHKNYQCCRSVWNNEVVEHVLKNIKIKITELFPQLQWEFLWLWKKATAFTTLSVTAEYFCTDVLYWSEVVWVAVTSCGASVKCR